MAGLRKIFNYFHLEGYNRLLRNFAAPAKNHIFKKKLIPFGNVVRLKAKTENIL